MVFPIRTDRPLRSTPWVNYTLIGVNVLVFLLTYSQISSLDQLFQQIAAARAQGQNDYALIAQLDKFPVFEYYLHAHNTRIYQFFTYMFLHSGWLHIIGNMVFLWVFGNNVEDRLGKLGYLGFFLAGGVFAGLGNQLWSDAPVLGASGAVTAVTGAYLVLFPKTNITLLYWWFIFGSFEVTARELIIFFVILDTVLNLLGVSNVAYTAHLTGYLFGFSVAFLFLLTGLLPREPWDLLAVFEQHRRRRAFAAMTRQGYSPWESSAPNKGVTPPSSEDVVKAQEPLTPQQQQILDIRTQITRAIADHDMPRAAELYRQMLDISPDAVLGQQHQLDLANQLMSEGAYTVAARAYELFLRFYRHYAERAHVHLILALIYIRYLNHLGRARELLNDDVMQTLDGSDAELSAQLKQEIGTDTQS